MIITNDYKYKIGKIYQVDDKKSVAKDRQREKLVQDVGRRSQTPR